MQKFQKKKNTEERKKRGAHSAGEYGEGKAHFATLREYAPCVMARIFLSFGSNLGDRAQAIARAQTLLEGFNIRFLKMSPLYETEPVCPVEEDCEQPWFLNAVAEAETDHAPMSLLLLCREVESRLGRDTKDDDEGPLLRRYLPRPIDIDILMYDDVIKESKLLTLPHPRVHLRKFILQPFCDIAPDVVHPVEEKSIAQLLKNVEDNARVKKFPHGH